MSPAPFQILSDLHLETHASYDIDLKQTAPNLAMLGDIGQVIDNGLFVFLEKQLRRYWNVFYVLGNHEPALTSWPAAKRRVRDFAERMESLRARSTIGRFIFLDQTRHDLNGTLTVLGCPLFSMVTPAQSTAVASRFVDFKQIQAWTVEDHINAHMADLEWLNSQVSEISKSEPERQIVIFTHYSPTLDERAIDEKHRDSPVLSGFSTDLSSHECWTSHSVIMWAFGHTHFSCDFVGEDGKRIAANQMAYASAPEKAFDAKKMFLVGREDSNMEAED